MSQASTRALLFARCRYSSEWLHPYWVIYRSIKVSLEWISSSTSSSCYYRCVCAEGDGGESGVPLNSFPKPSEPQDWGTRSTAAAVTEDTVSGAPVLPELLGHDSPTHRGGGGGGGGRSAQETSQAWRPAGASQSPLLLGRPGFEGRKCKTCAGHTGPFSKQEIKRAVTR